MIDISSEKVVSLSEAASLVPRRRAGKKCNTATVYRWTTIGLRGITLESIQIGGTKATSVEAMQRFFDALTSAASQRTAPAPPSPCVTAQRRKQIAAAERRLEKAGI